MVVAVNNINFFADEMEKRLIADIFSRCENPEIIALMRIHYMCGATCGKTLKDYFSIREPNFCKSEYAVDFKKITLSSIAELYASSFDEIKETCGVTLRDMVSCVMTYDKLHNNQGKSFPNRSELLVSNNGQIKLLNKSKEIMFVPQNTVDTVVEQHSTRSVVHATLEMSGPSISM